MFTESFYTFALLSIALLVLSFLTLFLATRHDKAIALAGPLEEEGAVAARIAEKRATLTDLELDLEQRRKALATIADVQAEVDALIRQRDTLLVEWNQSAERRSEVEALRMELEAAHIAKVEADAAVGEARYDLEELRERLAQADEAARRFESMKAEREALATLVKSLQDEVHALQIQTSDLRALQAEAEKIHHQLGEAEGKLASRQSELSDTETRLDAVKSTFTVAQGETDELRASLAAARLRMLDLASEAEQQTAKLAALQAQEAELVASIAAMTDLRADEAKTLREQADTAAALAAIRAKRDEAGEDVAALSVRKAVLEHEIAKLRGLTTDEAPTEEDPLRDLRNPPEVVTQLRGWPTQSNPSEAEALLRVKRRFEAFGLDYPDRTLRAFHTAMKVNESTQMTVLAGISGTGKSQLPRHYAAGMGIGFLQVPVQPRWDSPQDLMGFYNYIEGRFRPTDMARALFALDTQNNKDAVQDRLLMVLLDEMNLARVEYYFSDFLSRLESRPLKGREDDKNLRKDAEIELEIPKSTQRIFPGYNLLFAGTMNEDESTQSLSDKVVDRANVLRFGAPNKISRVQTTTAASAEQALDRNQWDKWCARGLDEAGRSKASNTVNEMLTLMQGFGKPFGHRLGRAILAYAGAYPEGEGISNRVDMALADQIEMRLLPKLRGVDVEEKNGEFSRLRKMAADLGDDALAQAIQSSVDAAELTGQFVWKGVMR